MDKNKKNKSRKSIKYLYIFALFIVPAIFSGIKGYYEVMAIFLIGSGIVEFLSKNPDFAKKIF